MSDDQDVYADWTALRVLIPAVIGLVLVGLAGLLAYEAFGPDPELASAPLGDAVAGAGEEPSDPATKARLTLEEFLPRLERGDFTGIEFAFTEATLATEDFRTMTSELGPFTLDARPGAVTFVDAANASAPMVSTWTLEDGTVFTTEGEVDLVLIGTAWLVDWEPAVLETSLDPGDVLVRERVVAPRAPILGRDGSALIGNRTVVGIGVVPRQVDDLTGLSEALGQLLQADPADIRATIAPQPSDSIVVVASRRVEELAPIEAQLLGLPGVQLVPTTFPLAPDERFARALLGRATEVTAEIIDEHPDLFQPGDVAGRSGLQRQYNAQLAGRPGFVVRVRRRFPTPAPAQATTTVPTADPSGSTTTTAGAAEPPAPLDPAGELIARLEADPDVVYLDPPVGGRPLQLTIDARIQRAAEDALTRTELPGALVAIQPSTGHILAVANGPGVAVDNFALTGRYPPGSIFKIVTAYAAMGRGVPPDAPVDCPLTLEVNGRVFSNAEGEVLGTVPMWQAFVLSCNTAFINLSSVLDPSDFPATAARFGVGVPYDLGTAAFGGSVPSPGGPVEKAATAFGQSQVLFSPLNGAVLAASAAAGVYRPPSLVLEPGAQPPAGEPLDPDLVAELQQMMRAVVTSGTGTEVSNVAGGPASGKTGTAEFGNDDPPRAHAWFVGYQADLAFAVFVEGGEFGGSTAAPIAANFLNRVGNS